MEFAGPLEHYSRLKTFFRVILAIPIVVLRYVMGLLLEIGAFAAWFVILVTGKMPRGLFDLMVLANSYTARSDAYLFLLTETYPPFQDDTRAPPARPARRSRRRPRRARPPRPLDRRDRVVLGGPRPPLAGGVREAADQLVAQLLRLDHRVDHQLGGEVQDVDVLGVLRAQLLGALRRARPRRRSPAAGCSRRR